MRLALLVPALSLTIICHAQTANKPIPGTKYSIAPPPNFTLANQFSGFQNRELNASIMFTELPADFHTIVQSFSADAVAAKGMTLIDRQNVTTNDLNGILIKVTQSNSGTVYLKNILLFGDSKKMCFSKWHLS